MKVTYSLLSLLLIVIIISTGCSTTQKRSTTQAKSPSEEKSFHKKSVQPLRRETNFSKSSQVAEKLIASRPPTPEPTTETDFSYIIGPGDVVKISVWRHPDLMNEITVQPDGKISFPIVHEVKAAGFTPSELENILANSLSTVIRDPDITINVTYFVNQKIFVLGEVGKPGIYPFPGNITILDAISYAEGYLDSASLNSIILVRKGTAKRINLYNLLNKADLTQNVPLCSGDIIFVPKSFIAQIDKFIDLFFAKTDPVLKYYLDVLDIIHYKSSSRVRY